MAASCQISIEKFSFRFSASRTSRASWISFFGQADVGQGRLTKVLVQNFSADDTALHGLAQGPVRRRTRRRGGFGTPRQRGLGRRLVTCGRNAVAEQAF